MAYFLFNYFPPLINVVWPPYGRCIKNKLTFFTNKFVVSWCCLSPYYLPSPVLVNFRHLEWAIFALPFVLFPFNLFLTNLLPLGLFYTGENFVKYHDYFSINNFFCVWEAFKVARVTMVGRIWQPATTKVMKMIHSLMNIFLSILFLTFSTHWQTNDRIEVTLLKN